MQEFNSGTNTEEDKSITGSDFAEEPSPLKKKYQKTKSVPILVSKMSLSTRKASTILQTYSISAFCCNSRSAESIFIPLQAQLDEYNTWRSVKRIISNDIAVNTGHKKGFVTRLQRQFRQKGLDEPQFIDCQQHIFDLVLWHLLDSLFPINSQSPKSAISSLKMFWTKKLFWQRKDTNA